MYKSVELRINGTCAVRVYVVLFVNVYVVSDIYIECMKINAGDSGHSVISEPFFADYYLPAGSIVSRVRGNFTVDNITASDGLLELSCKLKFQPSVSLLEDPQISALVTLELQGCPHARYGVHCDRPCSCAPGVECHPFTGICLCPKGLLGAECRQVEPVLKLANSSAVFVPYGESVILSCIAYGMQPSQWSWHHYGNKLEITSRIQDAPYYPPPFHLETNITATGPETNGMYMCGVVNGRVVFRKNVTVTVTHVPDPFLEGPRNQTVLLGSSVEFHCTTKPEAGTLMWVVGNRIISQWPPGLEVIQTSNESLKVTEKNQTVSIIIESAAFENAGRYRCIVGHEGGNDDAHMDGWLTVESQGTGPYIANWTENGSHGGVLSIQEGQPVNLTCQVREAYPEPTIMWFVGEDDRTVDAKVQARISSNGVSHDADSRLVLFPTWHDNGKTVTCVSNVTSFRPVRSRDVVLHLSYLPKVSISPPEKTVQRGEKPLFTCSAPANPPVTSYNWTLQHKEGKIIRSYTGRSVRVHTSDPDFNMATLTCYTTNNLGTNNSKAVIKVFDDPDDDKIPVVIMVIVLSLLVVLMLVTPIVIYRHRGTIQDLFFNNSKASNQEGKSHDVFVAYKGGGDEEEFVIGSLVPKLEEWGCDVCIHYQNFLPGREITDNINYAVTNCRKTLLVLSPDFMASEWCYFEFLCAMDEMLRNQTNFIIPLMFREIRNEELCHSMRNLLDTVSFIPWPAGTGQGQVEEFWKLLKRAVETKYNVKRENDDGEIEVNNNVVNEDTGNIHLI
ncbi:uncharacterized protein LOC110975835 isoform X2 [Acanthaster planci]|nr:uncharacterized protein LOC110975835 isoform X2 [Acanthaster planci]